MHIFIGKRCPISVSTDSIAYEGNIIFLKSGVIHRNPVGEVDYTILIDPTSSLSDFILSVIPENEAGFGLNVKDGFPDTHADNPAADAEEILRGVGWEETACIRDKRIERLIAEIKEYKYLGERVSKIAVMNYYSESRLTHLFKDETGISLKGYLILRQLEYVFKEVCAGRSITEAAIDAGFSSPSHFAARCKETAGISISDVIKADF